MRMIGSLRFTSEGDLAGPSEMEHQKERIEYHEGRLRLAEDGPYSMSSLASTTYHSLWLRHHRKHFARAKLEEMRDTYGTLRSD